MQNERPEPEFGPGDSVMIVCPCGAPPWPEGPVDVRTCVAFDTTTEESAYVVEYPNGRLAVVDGVELVRTEAWVDWMKRNAN